MKTIILSLFVLSTSQVFSQNADDAVIKILSQKDSSFWYGYNTCNLNLIGGFLTEDMELYHDKGGITYGADGMKKSMRDYICKDPNHKVRRELVPGTLQVFLLKDQGIVYGAILNGEHYFYNSYNGGKETKDGVAKFSNLWLLKDGSWKMHRILSFDHRGL